MITKLLLSLGIFLLLHLANLTEWLSYLSRPLLTNVATMFGVDAVDRGSEIVLGQLVLPWSQDCSGANILVILWGITIWAARDGNIGLSLVLRLLLCVPAALVCNLLRILTLAGYRYVFYPTWESEELHFLVGFLWLIPFLFFFVDNLRQLNRARWLELVHLSLVLALIAALIYSPGGSVVALCALFILGYSRGVGRGASHLAPAYLIWLIAAVLIAFSKMESLWIPWLLLCPRTVPVGLVSSWSGAILLAGTLPVLAMRWQWQLLVIAALAHQLYQLKGRKKEPANHTAAEPSRAELAVLGLLAAAPFFLSTLINPPPAAERPPVGIMSRQLTINNYQLRLTGQPADIRLYWYGPYSDGRHHSLENCMRFRGLILEPVDGQETVWTEGTLWMRDFFIHEGKLIGSYGDYLLATFSPLSPPGVHLIVDAPATAISPAYFARVSERLAKQIFELHLKQQAETGTVVAQR